MEIQRILAQLEKHGTQRQRALYLCEQCGTHSTHFSEVEETHEECELLEHGESCAPKIKWSCKPAGREQATGKLGRDTSSNRMRIET